MDQEKFLKNFANILGAGAQEELSKIEAKKKKENQLLEIFSSSLSKVADFNISASDLFEEPKEVIIPVAFTNKQPEKIEQPISQNRSVKRKSKEIKELNTSIPFEFKKESEVETAEVKKELELIKKSVADFQKLLHRQSQQISLAASSPGSGEVRVSRMDDVNRPLMKEAANGQVLTFDSTTNKWYPATPSGVGYTGSAANPSAPVRQLYISDGVTKTYTVLTGYASGQLDVFVDGIKIINGYEVNVSSGTTFTLLEAPEFGANIEVVGSYIFNTNPSWPSLFGPQGFTGSQGAPTGYAGSIGYTGSTPNPSIPVRQNYISDGTTVTYTVDSGYTPHQLDVYINGIKLFNEYEADVSNGTTFTLVQAPDFGSNIEVVGSYLFSSGGGGGGNGYTGSAGISGYNGSIGSVGFTGSVGIGYTGSQGISGFNGSIGISGYNGSKGYNGSTGTNGYNGSVGFTGSAGTNGYNGSSGFNGSIGANGYNGSIGANGYNGSIGFAGSQGSIGYNGSVGFTGSQGTSGFTGSVGVGYAGSQGLQGPSGVSATSPSEYGSYQITGRATLGDYTLTSIAAGSLPVSSSIYVTLSAGKTYQLRASLSIRSNYAVFGWYTESGSQIGLLGDAFSANSTDPGVITPAFAIYTPSVDTRVKLSLTAINAYTQTDNGYGEVSINQLTGQGPTGYTGSTGTSGTNGISLFSSNVNSDAITLSSNNAHGGTGYAGLVTFKNTTASATANTKYIRMSSDGQLQIINAGYSQNLLNIDDVGNISTSNAVSVATNLTVGGTLYTANNLVTKASAFVDAGNDVILGNIKVRMSTSGNRSLQISTVSGSYSLYGSGVYSYNGVGGATIDGTSPRSVTTTPTYINPGYTFATAGATDTWTLRDTDNTIAWRITLIVGSGYSANFISIERLI